MLRGEAVGNSENSFEVNCYWGQHHMCWDQWQDSKHSPESHRGGTSLTYITRQKHSHLFDQWTEQFTFKRL